MLSSCQAAMCQCRLPEHHITCSQSQRKWLAVISSLNSYITNSTSLNRSPVPYYIARLHLDLDPTPYTIFTHCSFWARRTPLRFPIWLILAALNPPYAHQTPAPNSIDF